jgi:hypothetical protein
MGVTGRTGHIRLNEFKKGDLGNSAVIMVEYLSPEAAKLEKKFKAAAKIMGVHLGAERYDLPAQTVDLVIRGMAHSWGIQLLPVVETPVAPVAAVVAPPPVPPAALPQLKDFEHMKSAHSKSGYQGLEQLPNGKWTSWTSTRGHRFITHGQFDTREEALQAKMLNEQAGVLPPLGKNQLVYADEDGNWLVRDRDATGQWKILGQFPTREAAYEGRWELIKDGRKRPTYKKRKQHDDHQHSGHKRGGQDLGDAPPDCP